MPDSPEIQSPSCNWKWFWCVWMLLFVLSTGSEVSRLLAAAASDAGIASWLSFWDMETTLPFLCFAVLPLLFRFARKTRATVSSGGMTPPESEVTLRLRVAAAALLIFGLSLGCSYRIGSQPVTIPFRYESTEVAFADLPPAYHDEYSYLLQARTFLSGQLSFPPAPVRPDLFHQMHVLNERRTVSRYFPTTSLWIAPFEALGRPIYGHWLAGALAAVFFYLSLLQVVRFAGAVAGGVLIAVSPGIAVFSNLLLAHHPTLLALSLFTWSFFRMGTTNRLRFAFVSGMALTMAMLARPITAAGYALPFGVWLLLRNVHQPETRRLVPGFALPLLIGLGSLAILNNEATGSWYRSAYQEYTERFTPRHRFGFNNAMGTETSSGPPALHAYDQWATNLTPVVAVKNVWQRLLASFQWSLAIMPLLFAVLMALPSLATRPPTTDRDHRTVYLRLLFCSFITLHLVHIPYWFDGIMHWHYVFETAPLLLALAAVGLTNAVEYLQSRHSRRLALGWTCCLVVCGLLPGWFQLPVFNDESKVTAAVSEQSFSRIRFGYFQRTVNRPGFRKPALVMVDERNSDPQLSYVINPPDLDADVLVCRRPETGPEIEELQTAFPDRTLYDFDPSTFLFERWELPQERPAD